MKSVVSGHMKKPSLKSPCPRGVTKGVGDSRVDQEQHARQVMDTNQPQAVFHQVLVLSVAFS